MKLPERGPCRRGPRKGNVKSAATLVEGLVDRFSDASSTLAASTKQGLEPICAPSLFFCLKTLTLRGAIAYPIHRGAMRSRRIPILRGIILTNGQEMRIISYNPIWDYNFIFFHFLNGNSC